MCQAHHPETVVFVLDACEDPGAEPARQAARLELLKQCIALFAQAKSRVNANHKYGLAVIRDKVQWEGAGVTASAEGLVAALRGVQPALGASHARPPTLDLGQIVSLVQPLAVAEEADGGRVRVILLYCRSTMLPVWYSNRGEGLCMDVLFVHDKTAAAAVAATAGLAGCPNPQDVYSWLEDNVDELSGRSGHVAYILEAGGHLVKKVTNHMISLVAHPAQRPPQSALRPVPLDLAAMPPQPTSATATTAAAAPAAFTPPAAAVVAPATSCPLADAATGYNPLFGVPHVAAPTQGTAAAAAAAGRAPGSWGSPRWPDPHSPPAQAGTALAGASAAGTSPSYASRPADQQPTAASDHIGRQAVASALPPALPPNMARGSPPPPYRPPGTILAPPAAAVGAGAMDPAVQALMGLSLGQPQAPADAASTAAGGVGSIAAAGHATWPNAQPHLSSRASGSGVSGDVSPPPYLPPSVYAADTGHATVEAGPSWPLPPPPAAAPEGH